MTGGPWYDTSICEKLHGTVLEEFIRNAITDRYNIMCSIDAHENIVHHILMMVAAVEVINYHQIQQQKYSFHSVLTLISLIVGCKAWNKIQ